MSNAIKVTVAEAILQSGTMTATEVARQIGVGTSTLYRYMPGGRTSVGENGMSIVA